MKLIIAGGRHFDNYELLKQKVERLTKPWFNKGIEVVCGEAKGADALGKQWAIEQGYSVASFPADWDSFGKSAGYRRNAEMAAYATHLIAFWDGESKGTKHMIDLAKKHGLQVRVIRY